MKATFCLPAHPSYFDDQYSQEEIEAAIAEYDRRHGGLISGGVPDHPVKVEFMLLRQPSKSVTVIFDSSGLGDDQGLPEEHKRIGIDQYRQTSLHDLQTHIANIKDLLRTKRLGYW